MDVIISLLLICCVIALIYQVSKEIWLSIEKKRIEKEKSRESESQKEAEYNKVKNSKIVFEIADVIKQKGVTYVVIKRYGISTDIFSHSLCLYKFSEKGLPDIHVGGMTALRDKLLETLGDGWTGSEYRMADRDFGAHEDDHIILEFKPKKKEYLPTREW